MAHSNSTVKKSVAPAPVKKAEPVKAQPKAAPAKTTKK
jgi:hypothetical protein